MSGPTRPDFGDNDATHPRAAGDATRADPPPGDIVRYGPGLPGASRAAEDKWRTGGLPGAHRRPGRLRMMLGTTVTIALLAASGVVLYLRFHHAPFHVTGAAISQQTPNGCGVNVTARISTNGAAGTVSYQWVFRGDPHAPVPLSQSAISGQHSVYVTVAVQGSGHGTASQRVSLQVLGPDTFSAGSTVLLKC